MFPQLTHVRYPDLPEELEFFRAEEILDMHPDRPRKTRQTSTLQKHPAVFIIGIGWPPKDGQRYTRAQRRHPGLELCYETPARADLDGYLRD